MACDKYSGLAEYLSTINKAVYVLNQDPKNHSLSEDIAIIPKGLPKEYDSQCSTLADAPRIMVQQAKTMLNHFGLCQTQWHKSIQPASQTISHRPRPVMCLLLLAGNRRQPTADTNRILDSGATAHMTVAPGQWN